MKSQQAVTLREAAGVADEVVAVTVGPLKAVDTLRVAMRARADRAVHVRTDESSEPLAVAKVLRAVVEREKPDILWASRRSITAPTKPGRCSPPFAACRVRNLCQRDRP